MWFTDFVIGALIFSFMLIGYYTYTTNISKQNSLALNDLILDAESISSSLLLEGFPDNWDNATVQGIGITNNNQRINRTKFLNFERLSYNKTKKLFGTIYDYLIFFTDDNDTIINVNGICGIGHPSVNVTYKIRSAYYYSDEDDKFLKDFMENQLNADIYEKGESGIDLPDLINNIKSYGLVVMEHPNLEGVDYNNYRDDLEDCASTGGFLMLSGQVIKPNDKLMLGTIFHKESGAAADNQNATVLVEDEFLTFEANQNITFVQAYYVINDSIPSENFTRIARFVDPSISDPDDNNAIARWSYGNGSVFFFSDFDATYFKSDFVDIVITSITDWTRVKCSINLNNTRYKNLVKLDRLLIYNSKPVKMVLYLWQ